MLYPNLKKFAKKKITIKIHDNKGGFIDEEIETEINGPLAYNKHENGEYVITHIPTGANIHPYGSSYNKKEVKENIIKLLKSDINWNFEVGTYPKDLVIKIKEALK